MRKQRGRSAWVGVVAMLACAGVAAARQTARQEAKAASAAPADKQNDYRVTILVSNEADEAPARRPAARQRVGHRREPHGPLVGRQQRHRHLDHLQGRRHEGSASRSGSRTRRPGRVFNGGNSLRMAPGQAGDLPLRERGRHVLRLERRRQSECDRRSLRGRRHLQGHGDPRRHALLDGLRRLQRRRLPRGLLRQTLRGGRHRRRLPGLEHPPGLLPLRNPGDRRLDLRDLRQEGRRGRRSGHRPRVRARVRSRREPRREGRIARPPELAVGHGDGALRLRPVRRLPARRQLRRRQDQRVLSGAATGSGTTPDASSSGITPSRSTASGASASATTGLPGPSNVLYFAAGPDDESNGYYGKIELAH